MCHVIIICTAITILLAQKLRGAHHTTRQSNQRPEIQLVP